LVSLKVSAGGCLSGTSRSSPPSACEFACILCFRSASSSARKLLGTQPGRAGRFRRGEAELVNCFEQQLGPPVLRVRELAGSEPREKLRAGLEAEAAKSRP
jgi:hypothetical protein